MVRAEVVALAREGVRPKAIARGAKVTPNAIRQMLHRARLADPTVPRAPGGGRGAHDLTDRKLVAKVKAAWKRGDKIRVIAGNVGIPFSSVALIVGRLRDAGKVEGRYRA